MRGSSRAFFGRIWAVAAVCAISWFPATALADQGAPADVPPRVVEPNPAADVATWLLVGIGDESADAVGLAGRLVPLAPTQRAQMARLARELEDERAVALRKLNRAYADKVRQVLDPEQRELYDGVLSVLEEMDVELTAARTEFAGAVGGAELPAPLPPRHVPIAEPADFLAISEGKRAALQSLRETLHAAVQGALLERLDSDAPADPDAWRERRSQFVQAREKAQAEHAAALEALLSPEEREQLQRIEEAAAAYNRRLREARREAAAKLLTVLRKRAPSLQADQ